MRPLGNVQGAKEKAGVEKESGLDTLRAGFEKIMAEKKARLLAEEKAGGENPPIEVPIVTACALGNSTHPIYFQRDVSTAGQPELVIIYPKSNSPNEKITDEPKMPTVICEAKLNNYNKGQVTYEWTYSVNYEFDRRYYSKSQKKYIYLCSRKGRVRFIGTSYSNNSDATYWTVSFDKNDAELVEFKAKQPEISVWPGYGGDCDEIITTWDEGEDIFIGGDVIIEVIAKDPFHNIISSAGAIGNRILGENPDPIEVYTYTTAKEIEAILRHESRTNHFAPNGRNYPMREAGWPIYGPPNGYGLMQLDNPPATENQMWNWKSNLDAGSDLYFNEKNQRQRII